MMYGSQSTEHTMYLSLCLPSFIWINNNNHWVTCPLCVVVYVWQLYASTIHIIFKSDHIMSKITIFVNQCFVRLKTRIELPKCVFDARKYVCFMLRFLMRLQKQQLPHFVNHLNKFQIKTTHQINPKRPIDTETLRAKCVYEFIIIIIMNRKRNEMYWIEYDFQVCRISNGIAATNLLHSNETNISILLDELYCGIWYATSFALVIISIVCCSLLDSEMSQFKFTHRF